MSLAGWSKLSTGLEGYLSEQNMSIAFSKNPEIQNILKLPLVRGPAKDFLPSFTLSPVIGLRRYSEERLNRFIEGGTTSLGKSFRYWNYIGLSLTLKRMKGAFGTAVDYTQAVWHVCPQIHILVALFTSCIYQQRSIPV